MLINQTNGTRCEVQFIDHIRIKGAGDCWELHIWPAPGETLEPHGAHSMEIPVPPEEIKRIAHVAPHLISELPEELGGAPRPYRLTANEQRRIAEAERMAELFRLQAQAEQEPADPLERGLAALDRLAADGQAWDAEPEQGEGNGSSGPLPLDPSDDPARHGQVVREGGKHYRL